MNPPLSVKYVLYAHLGHQEEEDFKLWRDDTPLRVRAEEARRVQQAHQEGKKTRKTSELGVVKYLEEHLSRLRELLVSLGYEGLLVLFYAPGFADCLEGIARGMTRQDLLKHCRSLRFAGAVAHHVETHLLVDGELARRVRFVTALDLIDVFGRMNWATAVNLRWWFIGSTPAIRYDTPKIVEAIIRLRLLGSGVPVFRLDYDVLFRGKDNRNQKSLGLFEPIAQSLQAYQRRRDESSVAAFLVSASYDTSAIQDSSRKAGFREWRGAFATRVFPALPVVPDLIAKVGKSYTWDRYAEEVFDEELARKFYGLHPTKYESNGVSGIGKLGAHPLGSVISGALLCLSKGAILDLPPFSNFALNVGWIDDHLKYCLHRELRHLTTIDLNKGPLLSSAKLDSVMLKKARAPIRDLRKELFDRYLPTLLWGTIMDAWITPDPLLKYRPHDLSAEDEALWRQIVRKGQSQAVLSSALQTALEKGHIDKAEKQALRKNLVDEAMKRINEVRNEWADLRNDRYETFASIWAKGEVSSYFPELEPRCRGIAEPGVDPAQAITSFQLNHFLYDDFRTLLDDAVDYIDWTLNWPQIVQVIRSVEQGSLRVDLSWER